MVEKTSQTRRELLAELEITELYYEILGRKPDQKALSFYKEKILNEGKSKEWVSGKIKFFYEKSSKIKSDGK